MTTAIVVLCRLSLNLLDRHGVGTRFRSVQIVATIAYNNTATIGAIKLTSNNVRYRNPGVISAKLLSRQRVGW
jgi:hypothetical protein